MTLSLALRNLLRNRRRSLATLLALAIGSASILMFGGYSTNIKYTMLSSYVRTGGHLQIQHRDFFLYGSGNPTSYGIAGYESLIKAITDDPSLKGLIRVVSPVLQFGGIAGNYEESVSRTVVGIGQVATDINRMRQWNEFDIALKSPRFMLEGATPDAAIVGVGVARVLLLCDPLGVKNCARPKRDTPKLGAALPADILALSAAEATSAATAAKSSEARLELLSSNGRGTPNIAALKVIAAEGLGFKELDDVAVILQLEQAQKLVYGREVPRVTSIMLQLERTAQIPAATKKLEALLAQQQNADSLVVLDFQTLNPFYVQTLQLFDTIFGFIFVLIGGIVLFTVGNTMMAAVVERTVEIGTVRAIGVRQQGIRRLFIAEGCVLGCAGALTGTAVALLVALIVNSLNLTWLPPGSTEPLPLSLVIWGETRMLIGTASGLLLVAVASAWWPAYRASRLKIVDALRHV